MYGYLRNVCIPQCKLICRGRPRACNVAPAACARLVANIGPAPNLQVNGPISNALSDFKHSLIE